MIVKKVLTPFQKFVQIESFSGILLLLATVAAMLWANSPFSESYKGLWQTQVGFNTGGFELYKPLILWINDGLMAIFFFLIGLEIKREVLIGELNSLKKLSFPLFGALGGMIAPVILFLILNENPETLRGWGIPMATDIAFALAILKVLGDRVPIALKIFLTAFAIVDDIGAVLVIAIFYSENINLNMLFSAGILVSILYFLSYRGYYKKFVLLLFGLVIWYLFLKSGLHPTIAGILLALAVPVRQRLSSGNFSEQLQRIATNLKAENNKDSFILTNNQIAIVDDLEDLTDKYKSPLQHLEHRLHNWVAYFIIPIFALANAGVALNSEFELDQNLILKIILCLVLAKSVGITAIILLVKKLKLITIPEGIDLKQIIGVGFLAGVGFTMAIFIANLAFEANPEYINSAKIGILIGSCIAGIIGYLILRFSKQKVIK